MWCLCHNVNLRCVFIYVNDVVFRWCWCGVVCLKNCCYLCGGNHCNICIDCFQVACATVDGNRAEGAENLSEQFVFKKLFLCEEVDLALQMNTDKENIVHTDMVCADDASAFLQFVFQAFDLHAEEELIDRLEDDLQKTVHFRHDE